MSFWTRAQCFAAKDQFKEAIADLDAAIKLQPKSPCYYEMRGALRINSGDYEQGTADLETAVRLNPKDPVLTYESQSKTPIDAKALEHGERQVRQMLKDRPAMAEYGDKAAPLYRWAAASLPAKTCIKR